MMITVEIGGSQWLRKVNIVKSSDMMGVPSISTHPQVLASATALAAALAATGVATWFRARPRLQLWGGLEPYTALVDRLLLVCIQWFGLPWFTM